MGRHEQCLHSWEIFQPINKVSIEKFGTEIPSTREFVPLKILDQYQTGWTARGHGETALVTPVPFMAQPMGLGYQPARPWRALQSSRLLWHHATSSPSHGLKGDATGLGPRRVGNQCHPRQWWVPLCRHSLGHPATFSLSHVMRLYKISSSFTC